MASVKMETHVRVVALEHINKTLGDLGVSATEDARLIYAEEVIKYLLNLYGDIPEGIETQAIQWIAESALRNAGINVPVKRGMVESLAPAVPVKAISAEDDAMVDEMFKYHAPEPGQIESYQAVNDAAKMLARVILLHAPKSADRTHAIRIVRDARMWANSAIALKGRV